MYKVGDVLWFEPAIKGCQGKEVKVEKVGRMWTYISNGKRIDKNGIADGGVYSPPGRCYASKEAYKQEVALNKAWNNLVEKIRYIGIPKDITIEKINQIYSIVGIIEIK